MTSTISSKFSNLPIERCFTRERLRQQRTSAKDEPWRTNMVTQVAVTSGRFPPARRLQQSLTAGLEKQVLVWIAQRVPAFISSDHLTALGFIAPLLTGLSYAMSRSDRI